jgi:Tfp pilus assembly protein PilO
MITLAAWPSWMTFVLVLVMVGPVMRMIFGSRLRSRLRGRYGLEDASAGRLESALAERDVVIEDLQRRLSEMESRLDFTERLLAERSHETKDPVPVIR